ncbi:polysaccharide deacetylase family protein [Methylicorpusculum oleiharenae]|uniref:polysaccharide deacetylase family protein n=1 Tax=Methylicorpusculum oleiharenae TaxID=1338687 RepID=UPI00135AC952|nr:polysaccharide deacetylase family protein [Methylicorpusculum oleiharenae]MCD2451811.1 polysaccharide deacetylase family protein [Methylicorpusculum oleiharenae]
MSRFIILMYHMISEPKTAAEVRFACPPRQFEKHLQLLLKKGYTPVSINQVSNYYSQNIQLPDKAVLITLDDGFEDNYLNALPIFERYQIPAVIYLATGVMAKTNQWMAVPTFSERKMLSWPQIQEMANHGMDFGSHTVSHPRLNELSNDNVEEELIASKKTIEDHLGKECAHFAYPYGLFTQSTRDLVEKIGFKTACSTRSGFNNAERDPLILHRLEVNGNDSTWKLNQKTKFGTNNSNLLFPLQYYSKRLLARLR